MSVNILYDGDPADLTLVKGDSLAVVDETSRTTIHGIHWDENPVRLSFDSGQSTALELLIRASGRWPRIRRKPSHPGPDMPERPAAPVVPEEPLALFSDGGSYSVASLYSDGSVA